MPWESLACELTWLPKPQRYGNTAMLLVRRRAEEGTRLSTSPCKWCRCLNTSTVALMAALAGVIAMRSMFQFRLMMRTASQTYERKYCCAAVNIVGYIENEWSITFFFCLLSRSSDPPMSSYTSVDALTGPFLRLRASCSRRHFRIPFESPVVIFL
jgi:hypothetical protein